MKRLAEQSIKCPCCKRYSKFAKCKTNDGKGAARQKAKRDIEREKDLQNDSI